MKVFSKATGVAVELPDERAQALLDAGNFQKTTPKAKKAPKAEKQEAKAE